MHLASWRNGYHSLDSDSSDRGSNPREAFACVPGELTKATRRLTRKRDPLEFGFRLMLCEEQIRALLGLGIVSIAQSVGQWKLRRSICSVQLAPSQAPRLLEDRISQMYVEDHWRLCRAPVV